MDKALHKARVTRDRVQVRYDAPLHDLPDGTMVWHAHAPALVNNGHLHGFSPSGYGPPIVAKSETILTVLTPKPTVRVLTAGYTPQIHVSITTNC